jgi:hypothetical protein
MSFLKKLFGSSKLDGEMLAQSAQREEYAQIELLNAFEKPRPRHEDREQKQWERVLPRSYAQQIQLFEKQGWITSNGDQIEVTASAQPVLSAYRARRQREKEEAMRKVRKALEAKDTSEALEIRRHYEAGHALGHAGWSGPDPQLSHSALTRRILFLEHWIVEGLSAETEKWIKLYAAEQHLWGTHWRLPAAEIPVQVSQRLAKGEMDGAEAAYWLSYRLALHVENQETWQRCKGGDHVRRIEIAGPDDEFTCEECKKYLGKPYLVTRVPELPHRGCTSPRGCRCEYVPVLESYEDLAE